MEESVKTDITRIDASSVVSVIDFDKKNHKISVCKTFQAPNGSDILKEFHSFDLRTLPIDLALELATAIVKVTEAVTYAK